MITQLGSKIIDYPEADGQPMTESDPTRDYLIYCVEALDIYFQSRRNVYVSGNLFVYFEEGNPQAVVSPDVFVVFGVTKRQRRSYKTWLENDKVPDFVLEITSKSTQRKDTTEKPRLYAQLGVQEYFQYDPTGDYLSPQLQGMTLVQGTYQPIIPQPNPELTLYSQVLRLELRLQNPDPKFLSAGSGLVSLAQTLRLYDPQTHEWLLTHKEAERARVEVEQAKVEAEQAKVEAEQAKVEAEQARDTEVAANRAAMIQLVGMGLTVEQVAAAFSVSVEAVMAVTSDAHPSKPETMLEDVQEG